MGVDACWGAPRLTAAPPPASWFPAESGRGHLMCRHDLNASLECGRLGQRPLQTRRRDHRPSRHNPSFRPLGIWAGGEGRTAPGGGSGLVPAHSLCRNHRQQLAARAPVKSPRTCYKSGVFNGLVVRTACKGRGTSARRPGERTPVFLACLLSPPLPPPGFVCDVKVKCIVLSRLQETHPTGKVPAPWADG